jgi:pimeloyl-ACP methyl ester carboxylesterase
MRRRPPIAGLAALLLTTGLATAPAAHASELALTPCASSAGFECTTVAVPLDRSGATAGTIALSVEVHMAGSTPSRVAVVALAGGPGQAALPLAPFAETALAPALASRDLLMFDQRGTGGSAPLRCAALEEPFTGALAQQLQRCALQIGPARGSFTTAESVEDIETMRRVGGYQQLVLYGTSYGTKVALEYAQRYPSHVQALVLDSVVPVDGPDPFAVPSYRALGPVLAELCEAGACARITPNPAGDLARLVRRVRSHPLRGYAYNGSGRRMRVSLGEGGVLEILQAGDLNPALRALFPAAVRSALRGDPVPILRLKLLAEGLVPNLPRAARSRATRFASAGVDEALFASRSIDEVPLASGGVDEALFVTTSCEEGRFPWQRSAPEATRLAEAGGALGAIPAGVFSPFDPRLALADSLVAACAGWPDASPPPPSPAPLAQVPTLILSGAQDMRTPTSNALQVASLIPGAQMLVVPFTGHSVLGSDFSGCAEAAVTTFFSGGTVQPCAPSKRLFAPTPIAPTKLSSVRPPVGFSGKPGRTLTAVLDAIVDLGRQLITATLEANAELPIGSSFGGLRGGDARLEANGVVLHNFSFVAGVRLSGSLPASGGELLPGTLHVAGPSAAAGSIRLASGQRVTGTLGGVRFNISLAGVHLARARWPRDRQTGWPARALRFPLPGLVERSR